MTKAKTTTELKKLSSVTTLFTSYNPATVAWKLYTPFISCGMIGMQGWSSGVGIKGNDNLEEKLFLMLYFSANQKKFKGEIWGSKGATLDVAPIGVGSSFYQFFRPKQNYALASNTPWIDRLEKFIKKYDLGTFHRGEGFVNPNWHEGKNHLCVWTWNGNHPDPAEFNYTED
jgi:hypothetical protein